MNIFGKKFSRKKKPSFSKKKSLLPETEKLSAFAPGCFFWAMTWIFQEQISAFRPEACEMRSLVESLTTK